MANLPIIVGTESGNAQMGADYYSDTLPALGNEVEVAGDDRAGVAELGDQTYRATFCKAGKDMDEPFARCGARRVGERLEIDACKQPLPDGEAMNRAQEWVTCRDVWRRK